MAVIQTLWKWMVPYRCYEWSRACLVAGANWSKACFSYWKNIWCMEGAFYQSSSCSSWIHTQLRFNLVCHLIGKDHVRTDQQYHRLCCFSDNIDSRKVLPESKTLGGKDGLYSRPGFKTKKSTRSHQVWPLTKPSKLIIKSHSTTKVKHGGVLEALALATFGNHIGANVELAWPWH